MAKGYKLGERLGGRPDRLNAKDASDAFSLMLVSDAYETAETLGRLLRSRVGDSVRAGLDHLRTLFATPASPGVTMAIESLSGIRDADEIRRLAPAYMDVLPKP